MCWGEDYDYFFDDNYVDFKWIIPDKLAGGKMPNILQRPPKWYYDKGIRSVLNVSGVALDFEHEFRKLRMSYMFNKTEDGHAPELIKVVNFVHKNIKRNKPVFVHCFGGCGRTGTVLAAYALYKGICGDADTAIKYVRKAYHVGAIESHKQKEALIKFSKQGFWRKLLIL